METDPKPLHLSVIDQLSDGMAISRVRGTLVTLFEPRTGENSVGPWKIQNGEIEQDGVKIPIQIKDRDTLDKTLRNRTIEITAAHGKQLTGVYIFDDSKNGTTVRKLKITPTATIEIIDGSTAPRQQQRPEEPRQETREELRPTSRQADPGPDLSQQTERPPKKSSDEVAAEAKRLAAFELKQARQTMIQVANLHLVCRLAVENYEAPMFKKVTGKDMSEGEKQAATASIFIKCDKIGMHSKMPDHPFDVEDLKK